MIATDYERILSVLATITDMLDVNQEQLTEADVRIRCLVNVTATEAKRALREVEHTATDADRESPERQDVFMPATSESLRY